MKYIVTIFEEEIEVESYDPFKAVEDAVVVYDYMLDGYPVTFEPEETVVVVRDGEGNIVEKVGMYGLKHSS